MRLPCPVHLLAAAVLGTTAVTAAVAGLLPDTSGTYACTYKHFSRCTEGSASVTVQDGRVVSVVFSASFCANKTQKAGSCKLDQKRGGSAQWTDEGRKATVRMLDPRYPLLDDELVVVLEDALVTLDFGVTQPDAHCAGGGDLPDTITIDPTSQACRVSF